MSNYNRPDLSQAAFIRQFNDNYREDFNNELFYRSDDDIILQIEKVILSCQRSKYFIIRVDKFTVVEDYTEINRLLKEQEKVKSKSKDKAIGNKYNYLTLKDSYIKLLVVDYYLETNNKTLDGPVRESTNLRVLIEIPRLVDKYYFRIFGNTYSSMYQIVDGSTYNNSQATNSRNQNVTLKTMLMATRIYRYNETIKFTDGEKRRIIYYSSRIFSKNVPVMKYLLAKFGIYELQDKLMVPDLLITDYDYSKSFKKTHPDSVDEYYTVNKNNLYITLPRYIYDNDITAQSLMYTIANSIDKHSDMNNIYTKDFWLESLGKSYGTATIIKGDSILDSLESILDISTKESMRLPWNDKKDIYGVLIWIIREFSELRQKDNLDVSTKRLRYAEYIAALYAMKLSTGIYRISDEGTNVTLNQIKKAIYTFPDYLLKMITKDRLVNYKNYVNDLDSLEALKFTYKGVSGLGEEKGSSIPTSYRQIHPSHIGRLDMDSSSNTDPGLSGTICPLTNIYNNSFSDYQEPNTWRQETDAMLSRYRDLVGLKEAIKLEKMIGVDIDPAREEILDESINTFKGLIYPIYYVNNETENPGFTLIDHSN